MDKDGGSEQHETITQLGSWRKAATPQELPRPGCLIRLLQVPTSSREPPLNWGQEETCRRPLRPELCRANGSSRKAGRVDWHRGLTHVSKWWKRHCDAGSSAIFPSDGRQRKRTVSSSFGWDGGADGWRGSAWRRRRRRRRWRRRRASTLLEHGSRVGASAADRPLTDYTPMEAVRRKHFVLVRQRCCATTSTPWPVRWPSNARRSFSKPWLVCGDVIFTNLSWDGVRASRNYSMFSLTKFSYLMSS